VEAPEKNSAAVLEKPVDRFDLLLKSMADMDQELDRARRRLDLHTQRLEKLEGGGKILKRIAAIDTETLFNLFYIAGLILLAIQIYSAVRVHFGRKKMEAANDDHSPMPGA
jgi:hypothetical protein